MSNINVLVENSLHEYIKESRASKFSKKDIMSDAQFRKLLTPECVKRGKEFDCVDRGYDNEVRKG